MINIEISEENLERTEKLLAGIPKGAERAFSNAINRGLSHLKTQAFKEVREVYAVKLSDLNSATKVRVQKAGGQSPVGYINFAGVKIPLYKFKASPSSPGSKQKVKAGVKIGGGATFENAFIARMMSGHLGVFERTGEQGIEKRLEKYKPNKYTEKVEEKMGLAAEQMIRNEDVLEKVSEEAQKKVNERLEHEIYRILNGYGG